MAKENEKMTKFFFRDNIANRMFTQGLNFCINLRIIFNFTCATSICVMLCNSQCLLVTRGRQMT